MSTVKSLAALALLLVACGNNGAGMESRDASAGEPDALFSATRGPVATSVQTALDVSPDAYAAVGDALQRSTPETDAQAGSATDGKQSPDGAGSGDSQSGDARIAVAVPEITPATMSFRSSSAAWQFKLINHASVPLEICNTAIDAPLQNCGVNGLAHTDGPSCAQGVVLEPGKFCYFDIWFSSRSTNSVEATIRAALTDEMSAYGRPINCANPVGTSATIVGT